jgi:xanthine dehydrogenase accessory factor
MTAAQALSRMIATVESGGTAACVTLAAGSGAGRRVVALRPAGGDVSVSGTLGSTELDGAARQLVVDALDDPGPAGGLHEIPTEGGTVEVYLEARGPVPELVIVGAGHIARPLSTMGALLGFRVTVVDDRPDFATRDRFPDAERLVKVDFSDAFRDIHLHAGSYILLVTRGHRYDYQCLLQLLRSDPPPAYIGMIGSRRRVRATFVQLIEEGVAKEQISDIHAPVGLDIRAETPEEIAVAVAAELVKVRRGGTGASLKAVERIAERFFSDAEQEEGA